MNLPEIISGTTYCVKRVASPVCICAKRYPVTKTAAQNQDVRVKTIELIQEYRYPRIGEGVADKEAEKETMRRQRSELKHCLWIVGECEQRLQPDDSLGTAVIIGPHQPEKTNPRSAGKTMDGFLHRSCSISNADWSKTNQYSHQT